MGVAQHEGDGHRLAQRAAHAQEDAADHRRAGVGQHDVPDHFGGGGAQRVGRLLQAGGHGEEDFAHHRGNERDHHDRQHDAGREHADAQRRAAEQRAQHRPGAHVLVHPGVDVVAQQRRQHEQAPHAVDDGRNAGQQFDRRAQRLADPGGGHFGEEQGDAEAHRHRDDHGDGRGDQGAVDGHQRAVLLAHRVPLRGHQEAEAELRERLAAAPVHGERGQDQRDQHEPAGHGDDVAEQPVADVV